MQVNQNESVILKNGETVELDENISVLNEIANSLVLAAKTLQSMRDFETNKFFENLVISFPEDGIDFYKAKKLYETSLIKNALRQTNGHQAKAAKLLNMNITTLNSIVKRYNLID